MGVSNIYIGRFPKVTYIIIQNRSKLYRLKYIFYIPRFLADIYPQKIPLKYYQTQGKSGKSVSENYNILINENSYQ